MMKFQQFMRFPLLGYKRYLSVFLISLTLIQGNPQACLEADYTTYTCLQHKRHVLPTSKGCVAKTHGGTRWA